MTTSKLTSDLHAFREKAQADQISLNLISQESPLERMRREIQQELEQSEQYRASILQNVTTFGKLLSLFNRSNNLIRLPFHSWFEH